MILGMAHFRIKPYIHINCRSARYNGRWKVIHLWQQNIIHHPCLYYCYNIPKKFKTYQFSCHKCKSLTRCIISVHSCLFSVTYCALEIYSVLLLMCTVLKQCANTVVQFLDAIQIFVLHLLVIRINYSFVISVSLFLQSFSCCDIANESNYIPDLYTNCLSPSTKSLTDFKKLSICYSIRRKYICEYIQWEI